MQDVKSDLVNYKPMKIKPLGDKVLLKLLKPEEKVAGGIYIPEDAQSENNIAEVIAVGEGRLSESGQLVKAAVKQGQKVLIKGKWAGDDVTVEGEDFKIVSDSEILAVIS